MKAARVVFILLVSMLVGASLAVSPAFTATVKHKRAAKPHTLPCWYGLFIPPKEGGRLVCGRMVYWI